MAHNLHIDANGKASFVSGGNQKAWHGLGQILPDTLLTSVQCIEHAGLGYTVEKAPAIIKIGGQDIIIPDTFSTYRTDTKQPFAGTVGKKYTIVQNSAAFGFFDNLVGEGAAIYETAGALGLGERIFLTAKLSDFCRVGKDDITEMYVVLSLTHDGSGSIKVMLTPIRVVCQNTLNAAIRQAVNVVNIRHTSTAEERLNQAHEVLDISNKYVTEMNEILNAMANTKVSDKFAEKVISDLFTSNSKKDGVETSTRAENIRNEVLTAYHSGIGQYGIVGTAYGLYNGVTNYLSHVKTYGNVNDPIKAQNIKFQSLLEGQASKIQQTCFDTMLTLLN